jgi:putative SOS response-associated peptidase YedK
VGLAHEVQDDVGGRQGKAVNNIADLKKWPWSFHAPKPERRCLIPLTGFAEAEGLDKQKTRTWFNVKGQPIFAWAGLWRVDEDYEWGPVYSGVMTDCNEAIRPVHDRMPVHLMPDDYDCWINRSFDDAVAFQQRCFPDGLIEMVRTTEPWNKPKSGLLLRRWPDFSSSSDVPSRVYEPAFLISFALDPQA